MDDQWAVAHLALSSEAELRGVVTTHAPNLAHPAASTSARCVGEVLAHVPNAPVPTVIAGSSVPLLGRIPASNAGVDFVLEESLRYSPDTRLVVLVLGAVTDVASVLLTDPSLSDRIEVIAMGFDTWPDGHDEFNVLRACANRERSGTTRTWGT
jgi:purine nucleosidase